MPTEASPSSSPGPLRYREVTEPGYAQRAADHNFVLDAAGSDLAVLRGACPRCGDFMTFPVFTWLYKAARPKGQGTSYAKQVAGQDGQFEPMICTCEEEHPGRPAKEEGCGAYWKLRITFELSR